MSRNIRLHKRKDKKSNLLPSSMVAERMRQLGAFAALLMFIFSSLSTSQLMLLEMNSPLDEDPHFSSARSGNDTLHRLNAQADTSIYGGGVVGRQLTGGLDLADINQQKGFYSLNNGYASPTGSAVALLPVDEGTYGDANSKPGGEYYDVLRGDPDLVSGTSTYAISKGIITGSGANFDDLQAFVVSGSDGGGEL